MKSRLKNLPRILIAVALLSILCILPVYGQEDNQVEIERKFLLDVSELAKNIPIYARQFRIVQTYISYSPEMRVREVNNLVYYFALKRSLDDIGLAREEIEFQITKEEYEDLLKKKEGETIYKTRYQFYLGKDYIAIDVYAGNLAGLAVAEVEFSSVEEAESYQPPKWFGKDVTSDKRYKNANLARYGMPDPK